MKDMEGVIHKEWDFSISENENISLRPENDQSYGFSQDKMRSKKMSEPADTRDSHHPGRIKLRPQCQAV
jgi:hypothetical protein